MSKADIVNLMFSYYGRVARGRFWLGVLILIISIIPEILLAGILGGSPTEPPVVEWWILFFSSIVQIYVQFALYVKRCHDLGNSGWLSLLIVVPVVGFGLFIYLGFFRGESGPNMYGPDPFGAPPNWSAAVFE